MLKKGVDCCLSVHSTQQTARKSERNNIVTRAFIMAFTSILDLIFTSLRYSLSPLHSILVTIAGENKVYKQGLLFEVYVTFWVC